MIIACSVCKSKYTNRDDRPLEREVRFPCKRCGAPIIVHATQLDSQLDGSTHPTAGGKAAASPAMTSGLPHQPSQREMPGRSIRNTLIGVAAPTNTPSSV